MFKRCFICISLILNVNLKSKTALTDPAETFFFFSDNSANYFRANDNDKSEDTPL